MTRKKRTSTKKKTWQTGKSNKKADSQRKAKKPGKRKSASGKTYIERRKNRSDMPHSLTGHDKKIEAAIHKIDYINKQIKDLQRRIKAANSPAIKDSYRALIRIRKRDLMQLKKFIRQQSRK